MRTKWRTGAGIAMSLVIMGADARAEPPIVLVWDAPSECPSQSVVMDRIHQRLGGKPAAGRSRLAATAKVEHQPDARYRVRLRTDLGGIEGERELVTDSCESLADAAALVLALTFDPEAVAAAKEQARMEQPPPAPAPTVAPRPAPAVVQKPPPVERVEEKPWNVAVHAALDVSVGALPGAGIGANGGVALIWSRVHVALGCSGYPPQSTTLEGQSAGGSFWLIDGSVWAGYAVLVEPLYIAPGLGLEIGVMSAEGISVPRPGEGAGLWLTPFASGVFAIPIAPPLGLRLELAVGIPVFRPQFVLERLGTVHRAAPAVGRFSVGPELRF